MKRLLGFLILFVPAVSFAFTYGDIHSDGGTISGFSNLGTTTELPWDNVTHKPASCAEAGWSDCGGGGGSASSVAWDNVTDKPTTCAGTGWPDCGGSGTGDGDMLKSVYDVNEDGIVDSAIATAITPGLITNSHISSSANIDGTKILNDSITPGKLTAYDGTPGVATFYRGDGTWAPSPANPPGVTGQLSYNKAGSWDTIPGEGYDSNDNTIYFPPLSAPRIDADQGDSGGSLTLREAKTNGSEWIRFKVPDALSNNVTFILPSADGTSGQYLMTDGTGNLGWGSGGGGGSGTMVYPSAGIAQSTGFAWGSSLSLDTDLSSVSANDDSIPSAKATKAYADTKSTASGTETLTNKTLSVDATGNNITLRPPRDFTIIKPTAADGSFLYKAQFAQSVTGIRCIAKGGGTIKLRILECSSTGGSCAGIDGSTTIICDSDGATDDGSLSNPSIDAGDWVSVEYSDLSGTVDSLTYSIYMTETQ